MDYILLLHVTVVTVGVLLNLDVWKEFPDVGDGSNISLILLGKTGNGRSSLGNNLLGRHVFESHISPTPVTRHSRLERTRIGSRNIFVVDTPGLHVDPKSDDIEENIKELTDIFSLCSQGYNAFLIVVNPVNRISKEEMDTIHFLKIIFGENFLKYVIFIFTHRDIFEANTDVSKNVTEEFMSYLDNIPGDIKHYIETAGHRVMFVDSLESNSYRNRIFHADLIRTVDEMRVSYRGRRYTKEFFDQAQEKLKMDIIRKMEEEERTRREHDDRIRSEALKSCANPKKTNYEYDDSMRIVLNFDLFGGSYIKQALDFLVRGVGYVVGNVIDWGKDRFPAIGN